MSHVGEKIHSFQNGWHDYWHNPDRSMERRSLIAVTALCVTGFAMDVLVFDDEDIDVPKAPAAVILEADIDVEPLD